MQAEKNPTASALLGVAAILILVGAIGGYMYSPRFGWIDWLVAFSGAAYVGLALAARWARLPAASVGALLFGAYIGFQASNDIEVIWRGWIIKAPIAILLLVALIFAFRTPAERQTTTPPRTRRRNDAEL